MGSSCVSRLCSDCSGQESGSRQPTKKVVKDCATQTPRSQTSPKGDRRGQDSLQHPRDAFAITDEQNDPHGEHASRHRSIVMPSNRTLLMVVPSSPLHHDDEQGSVMNVPERSLSKLSRQRSADKSSSATSMTAVYGDHPLAPLAGTFDSIHASHNGSLDTADNEPAATRSMYSLTSNDLLRSHSTEEYSSCCRHRPWRSAAGGRSGGYGGGTSPNSPQRSSDGDAQRSSSSSRELRNLRLPHFHL